VDLVLDTNALLFWTHAPERLSAVDAGLWLDSVGLDWTHRDPVDRLVVALARRQGAHVVTVDHEITAWYDRVLW
jgi:PIN domain nuclease of toxin-antitoxin system